MNKVKIKICGLFRPEDAAAVNHAMPDYAGFVFAKKSRRYVAPALAAELRKAIDPQIITVGVFVNAATEDIVSLYQAGTISIAQLHGTEDEQYIKTLRKAAPDLPIWQAFVVSTPKRMIPVVESTADLVLLDGGAGEGKPFNWLIAEEFPRPFVLAGGLTAALIPKAIDRLAPYAVDLSSGVETDGLKDEEKIIAAVAAARRINHE